MKLKNYNFKNSKFWKNIKASSYVGCYPSGYDNDILTDGLTKTLVDNITDPTPIMTNATSNGFYLILVENMTIETCLNVCELNGFMFAGLNEFVFFLFDSRRPF